MMTTDELIDLMKGLPEDELERLRIRLDSLISTKKRPDEKGNRIRALAGRFNLGECLQPDWDRDMLYED